MSSGRSEHHKPRPYLLAVCGVSSCNCFAAGEWRRNEGIAAMPPFSPQA